MEPIRTIRSRTAVLAADDVDTDQIIPARFLTTTRRDGFERALFADWRFDAAGRERPDFVLNRPENAGSTILVAGRNFGCGSSREHAAWALRDFGIRAVVSPSFADIFRANALKNGVLPVAVDAASHAWLMANAGADVEIDLQDRSVALPDGRRLAFAIDAFARHCLLQGMDQLAYLLDKAPAIAAFEQGRGG